MIKKTIVIAGKQGERGDKIEEMSVPIDGVLGFTETGTPDGYVEAGYFKVTGLDEVDSRIDVIEALPEGSTSGDAEVADIRVGVDGEIYDSAGIAVRDQITELHDYAESIDDVQDAQIETLKVTKAVEGEYITINDAAALPAKSLELSLSPVQDLNGYDSPWVGGAGKNKLAITASTTTINGVAFTVNKDSAGNVLSVKAHGQASARAVFVLWKDYSPINDFIADGQYIMNGCPVGGSESTYQLILQAVGSGNVVDAGAGIALNTDNLKSQNYRFAIDIKEGYNAQNLMFYPMVRLSTVTDSTFAPYSNLCPIHGTDEVGVNVCGLNICDNSTFEKGRVDSGNIGYADGTTSFTIENGGVTFTTNTGYRGVASGLIKAKENTAYYCGFTTNAESGDLYRYIDYYDKSGAWLSRYSNANSNFTTPANCGYFRISFQKAAVGTVSVSNLFINYPATDTTYHAYIGSNTPLTLPTTVYGGTVDVTGGSGQETIGYAEFDGSNDEAWDIYQADGINQLYIPTADLKGYTLNLYANEFKTISINDRTGNYGTIYTSSTAICVNIENIASVADFRTWLASHNLQVAYELATPSSLSTTPTSISLLNGVNNVWSECSEDGAVIGDAEQDLTYQRDTTLVIKNLINRIEALERRN